MRCSILVTFFVFVAIFSSPSLADDHNKQKTGLQQTAPNHGISFQGQAHGDFQLHASQQHAPQATQCCSPSAFPCVMPHCPASAPCPSAPCPVQPPQGHPGTTQTGSLSGVAGYQPTGPSSNSPLKPAACTGQPSTTIVSGIASIGGSASVNTHRSPKTTTSSGSVQGSGQLSVVPPRVGDTCTSGCQTLTCCNTSQCTSRPGISSSAESSAGASSSGSSSSGSSSDSPSGSSASGSASNGDVGNVDTVKNSTATHLHLSASPFVAFVAAGAYMTL